MSKGPRRICAAGYIGALHATEHRGPRLHSRQAAATRANATAGRPGAGRAAAGSRRPARLAQMVAMITPGGGVSVVDSGRRSSSAASSPPGSGRHRSKAEVLRRERPLWRHSPNPSSRSPFAAGRVGAPASPHEAGVLMTAGSALARDDGRAPQSRRRRFGKSEAAARRGLDGAVATDECRLSRRASSGLGQTFGLLAAAVIRPPTAS